MGTTANHDFPYPEGTDLVISGDDAIQALADAVDTTLEWTTAAAFAPANASQAIGGATVIHFTGSQSLTGFSYDGAGGLHYLGAIRPFIVCASVSVTNSGTNPEGWGEVRVNNVAVMGSDYRIAGSTTQTVTHTISVPIFLTTSDVVSFVASATPGGTAGVNSLRVFPIGPLL